MVYEEFLQTIKTQLEHQLGDSYTFTIRQVSKNNGIVLDGLSIGRQEEKIAPTIYLNEYYPKFLSGTPISSITEQILTLYTENTEYPSFDFNKLTDFSLLKEKILFKLINHQSNQKLLEDIPHIPYLDLTIVFYILLENDSAGQMTALIHNDHMALWKLTPEELHEIARKNTPLHMPAMIKSMTDVMCEIAKANLGDDFKDEYLDDLIKEDEGQTPLYVLSNTAGFYGAGCMLYDDVLKLFSETTHSDFIILPSSIHEVLLIPSFDQADCQELSDMVTNINKHEVSVEDRLSNQVYYYKREENKISLASFSNISISSDEL